MGAISFSLDEQLLEFLARQVSFRLFVETGAFQGDTLAMVQRHIPRCRSVEMSPELHEKVRARFEGRPDIVVECSDSPAFLRAHQAEFAGQATLFWLDAHWCEAEHTSGQTSQSPLLAELAAIGGLHPDSVLLIDDARLYVSAPPKPHQFSDWPDLHSVVTALLALSPRHRLTLFNDVLVFYPERLAAAVLQYAHENGTDWLKLIHLLRGCETREKEWLRCEEERRLRRQRRFPKANFFRHHWRRIFGKSPAHAPD